MSQEALIESGTCWKTATVPRARACQASVAGTQTMAWSLALICIAPRTLHFRAVAFGEAFGLPLSHDDVIWSSIIIVLGLTSIQ